MRKVLSCQGIELLKFKTLALLKASSMLSLV